MDDSERKKQNSNSSLYLRQREYGRVHRDTEDLSKDERKKTFSGGSRNTSVLVMVFLMILVTASVLIFALGGKKTEKKVTPVQTPTPTASLSERIKSCFAIVLSVSPKTKTIEVQFTENGSTGVFNYDGVSVFHAEQGSFVTAEHFAKGDFVKIGYVEKDEGRFIRTVDWSDEVWENKNVQISSFNDETKTVNFRGQNYRYTDDLLVINNGMIVSKDTLNLIEDKLTVRGIGDTAHEMIVTTGHGKLRLTDIEDFIGGYIEIGLRYEFDIEEKSEYTIREGKYDISLQKGARSASGTIIVKRDETTVFSPTESGYEPVKIAKVYFTIEPFGAALYINGDRIDYYNKPVELEFGSYFVSIKADGHKDISSKLVIDKETQYVDIKMSTVEMPTPTPVPTKKAIATPTPSAGLNPPPTPTLAVR